MWTYILGEDSGVYRLRFFKIVGVCEFLPESFLEIQELLVSKVRGVEAGT